MYLFAKEEILTEQINLEEFSFSGLTVVFRDELSVIKGYAHVYYDSDTKILSIHEIEMIEKGKGLGKKAIESILKLYKDVKVIEGISREDAVSFWNKFDAISFFDTCRDCDLCGTEDCPLVRKNEVCDEYNENHFEITIK